MNAVTMDERGWRENLGRELRQLRGEESQGAAAQRIGISQPSLSMYESGKRTPQLHTAAKVASAYGVTLDELVGRVTS